MEGNEFEKRFHESASCQGKITCAKIIKRNHGETREKQIQVYHEKNNIHKSGCVAEECIEVRQQDYLAKHTKIIEKDLYESSARARIIIEDTEKKAMERLHQVEEIVKEEQMKAFNKGYKEGLQKAGKWVIEARRYYMQVMKESERDLIELSLRIAEKVIGEILKAQPELMLEIAWKALKKMKESSGIIIRIHSTDYEMARNCKELQGYFSEENELKLVADDTIQQGGCIIETDSCKLDSQVKTQLEIIAASLLKGELPG